MRWNDTTLQIIKVKIKLMKILRLFKKEALEEYIKKSTDLIGKRKYRRLPTNVPVLYAFTKEEEKKEDFKQAITTDISAGGLGIEIINPPDIIGNKFLLKDKRIIMEIDIPSEEEMIKFTGIIRWKRVVESKKKIKHLIGIEYEKIDPDDKVSILSYALKVNRRKKMVKLSIIALSILIIASTSWGALTQISKNQVEKELKVSEDARSILEKDIQKLIKTKADLDKQVEENTQRIKEKEDLLTKKENQVKNIVITLNEKEKDLKLIKVKLDEQVVEIAKTNDKLSTMKKLSAQLEERIYVYIVSSDQESVFLTSKSNTAIFDNENYKKALTAMKNNKCTDAVKYYRSAIDSFPDSPIGYSGLTRAYNCLGNYTKSKEAFQGYLKLQQKELESQ